MILNKKTHLTLAFTFILPITTPALASGIPTVDVAAIAQMVIDADQQLRNFEESYQNAKDRLENAKARGKFYQSMVEGYTSDFEMLTDPSSIEFMLKQEWKDIYNDNSNIQQLRNEFGLNSADPEVQENYDRMLKDYNFFQKTWESSQQRQGRIRRLSTLFEMATSPAIKQDLSNRLNYERMQIQTEAKMIKNMQDMMERRNALIQEGLAEKKLEELLLN